MTMCEECLGEFNVTTYFGPRPRFCGSVCKQRAYRKRKALRVETVAPVTSPRRRVLVTVPMGIHAFTRNGPVWTSTAWQLVGCQPTVCPLAGWLYSQACVSEQSGAA